MRACALFVTQAKGRNLQSATSSCDACSATSRESSSWKCPLPSTQTAPLLFFLNTKQSGQHTFHISTSSAISGSADIATRDYGRERESKPFLTATPSFIAFKSPNTDSHIITNTMTNKRPMTFEANENVLCFHGPLLYEAKVYCIEIKH